ncbi:DUF4221 domain-containing protein [Halosquirtibacter laminarini]|uniref:DUF4221 domain-containing protein n=1 Tax=Halosquirtibacter laminarini TaxID=3374600 RepID=A0AC61NIU5_9BACT|nr:DUF4221 domain-containing protein [Prolixibacteraceae bacterium]
MRFLLIYTILSILLFSCNDKNKKVNIINNERSDINSSFFIKQDSFRVKIPNNSYNYYHVVELYDNRYLFAVNLLAPLQLNIIDLVEKKHIDQISIDPNLFKTTEITNMHVHNIDSIYFLSSQGPMVYLINRDGAEIDKWTSPELEIPYNLDSVLHSKGYGFATSSYLEGPDVDVKNSLLFVKLSPISSMDEIGDVNIKRHGVYDLKKRKWKFIFGKYKGVLEKKKEGRYYYDMQHPYQLKNNNHVYVTYPVDHSIYSYDLETNQYLGKIENNIPISENFPSPLYGKKALDYSSLIALRKATPYYGPLYYHKESKKYSRFFNHIDKKHRSIILFDENLKFIEIKTFKVSSISKIIACDDGFFAIQNDQSKMKDADYIHFIKIKI